MESGEYCRFPTGDCRFLRLRALEDRVSHHLTSHLAPSASLAVPTVLKYLGAMATSTPSKQVIIRVVAQFAAEQPTVMAAYLFGSVAQNRMTAESDVDVGLLFETPPDEIRLLELREELTSVLKYPN